MFWILYILYIVGDVTPKQNFQNDAEDNYSAENNGTDESYDPEVELEIDYLFQEFLESSLAFKNETTLYKMGHKYKDFVFDCNFRGIDCRYVIDHDSYRFVHDMNPILVSYWACPRWAFDVHK